MNTPLYAYAIAAIGFAGFGLMVLAAVLNGKDVEDSFSSDVQKHHNCWSYWAVCPVCIKKWRRFTSKDGDFNHVHRCPNCK